MNKKVVVILAVATVIGVALGTYAVTTLMGTDSVQSFDKTLVQLADTLNANLPMMLDKETRFDATFPGPGNRFTYIYTLLNYSKADVDPEVLRRNIQPQILANYKSHPEMKSFRDHDVELHYQYKDKSGIFMLEIVVSPKDF